MDINPLRIRRCVANDVPVDPKAAFVLYWMTASRRMAWNYAMDRAVDWACRLCKPLVILETMPLDNRWASERHHAFVLQGMADNANACKQGGIRYYPFVESKPGDTIDLLAALADLSCVVVTDDFPIRSVADDIEQAAGRIGVPLEAIDSSGLLPLRAAERIFSTAHSFRRVLQRTLPDHLPEVPKANPMARKRLPRLHGLPARITRRWPAVPAGRLANPRKGLASLPLNHDVGPVDIVGGPHAARKALKQFLRKRLADYVADRNHPDADATSGLSPYLHFGHISPHEIFHALAKAEGWSPANVAERASGSREGWWGMSPSAEAFLDQLLTWREVGFNRCAHSDDYDQYESLPDWAKKTLAEHAADPRPYVYTSDEFQKSATHDPLWNAAQTQLVREGRMHNYLRMLWGKKILEWSAHPQEALETMIELNNKYALDGQDPNSYSGICWVLGRYDRPWGPERPIFGKIRFMSSQNTARKLRLRDYFLKYADNELDVRDPQASV
ncbi:MAG TPA: deoxyribodipyrimidine photo-lyase [Thermoguttaceae bacterium]|nr:deoxyribodipyrimidine photo-lyase [Thermoguttaceae bacterium]